MANDNAAILAFRLFMSIENLQDFAVKLACGIVSAADHT